MTETVFAVAIQGLDWSWFEALTLLIDYVVALAVAVSCLVWFMVLAFKMVQQQTPARWFWFTVVGFSFVNGAAGFGDERSWQVNATITIVIFLFFYRR